MPSVILGLQNEELGGTRYISHRYPAGSGAERIPNRRKATESLAQRHNRVSGEKDDGDELLGKDLAS